MLVMVVGTSVSVTTLAAIAIVQNVKAINGKIGLQARRTELLPVPYFHVVFTLPDSINSLAMHQPKIVYDTLFEATWETLKQFGKAKEMQMGMIAVLHTWGQQLSLASALALYCSWWRSE